MHLAGRTSALFQPHLRGIGWWKSTCARSSSRSCPITTFRALAEEVIFQDSFFRSAVFEQLPSGPIHADLFRDNVLFDGGAIGGVIDFYFAGCSIWLFDIAVTVNDWCVDLRQRRVRPARAQALLAGVPRVRPLTRRSTTAGARVLRAAALRFWMSRLYDLHLPRAARPADAARSARTSNASCERRISDATAAVAKREYVTRCRCTSAAAGRRRPGSGCARAGVSCRRQPFGLPRMVVVYSMMLLLPLLLPAIGLHRVGHPGAVRDRSAS